MSIREEIRLNYVKGSLEDGKKAEYIASVFKLPVKKVEEVIKKIGNTLK